MRILVELGPAGVTGLVIGCGTGGAAGRPGELVTLLRRNLPALEALDRPRPAETSFQETWPVGRAGAARREATTK